GVSIEQYPTVSFTTESGATWTGWDINSGGTDVSGVARLVVLPGTISRGDLNPPSSYPFSHFTAPSINGDTSVTVTVAASVKFSGVVADGAGQPIPNLL